MNIGLSMLFCLGQPFPDVIKQLPEFDLRCVELVDEGLHVLNRKRVSALKKLARDADLDFTIHAPFVDINIASPNPVLRHVMLKRLEKSLSFARDLNCKQWIFHSGWKSAVSEFYPNLDWQIQLRSVRSLVTVSKKLGVDIAMENNPEPFYFLIKRIQDVALFYAELGADIDVGLTLDVGHANTTKETFDFIDKFGDRIVHVHISDNEGKFDQHKGIGYGKINWEVVAEALRRIDYRGFVMCESVDHIPESIEAMRRLFA